MKQFGIAVAAFLFVSSGFESSAVASRDVDVTPDPAGPRLILEGNEIVPPNRYRPTGSKRDSGRKPVSRPPRLCQVDEAIPTYGCRTYRPADNEAGDELTEGDILRAVREIGLPSLKVQIQPGTSTLVNVPTIFYAEPQAFNRSVTLLGFDIDLIATPVLYRWLHGDGTASTTTGPGKPYPSTEVTHRYRQPDPAVNPRVDVTYRVRYRVDGGAWTTIDQTLLASGPAAALEVREAAPVLTHP